MDRLPATLVPGNTKAFAAELDTYVERALREDVYAHVLANAKDAFYDLSSFRHATHPRLKPMVKRIQGELEALGWKTTLSYGDTALFVYTGAMPLICW